MLRHLLSNGSVAELGASSVVDLIRKNFLELLWHTFLNGVGYLGEDERVLMKQIRSKNT